MGQLEYDNSAFYYFMIAMLSVYLVPGYFYTAKYVLSAFAPEKTTFRSKLEKEKATRMGTNLRGVDKLSSRMFVISSCILGATTLLFAYLVYLVSKDSSIASFDPYNILSLDRGATDKQIKKAYKLKALEFHPDKNIGDERAAQMFMMVAKAYEALTDEQAKENWEKYGNPDGKQSFEMSIGLPTFLMDGENHNVILLVYLLIMVIAVPVVVYMIYTNSQMYGENNILYATTGRYGQRMLRGKRAPRLGDMAEIYVMAAEFDEALSKKAEDSPTIQAMYAAFDKMNSDGGGAADKGGNKKKLSKASKAAAADDSKVFMAKPSKFLMDVKNGYKPTPERDGTPPNPDYFYRTLKGSLILHRHMGRAQVAAAASAGVPTLPPQWEKALNEMLVASPNMLKALIDMASEYPQLDPSARVTKFETTYEVMQFSQCLTQAIVPRGAIKKELAPFYQLPHVTAEEVAIISKQHSTLQDYIRVKFNTFCKEQRKSEPNLSTADLRQMWTKMGAAEKDRLEVDKSYVRVGLSNMDDEKVKDVNAVCDILPDVEVDVEWFVDDEDFIAQGDMVTLKVTLTRHHMADGASKPDPVHAPFFPLTKEEGWWVVLRATGKGWEQYAPWEMRMEKITDQGRKVVHEMKFPAPVTPPKAYQYTVHVISDSYLGLDHATPFDLQVEDASMAVQMKEESDDELVEEVPLEAFMGGNENIDSDLSESEEEEEEAEQARPSPKAQAAAKARAAAIAAKAAEADKGSDGLTAAQRKKKEARLKKKGGEDGDAVLVEAEDADENNLD